VADVVVLVDVWAFAPAANAAMIVKSTSDRFFIDEALLLLLDTGLVKRCVEGLNQPHQT